MSWTEKLVIAHLCFTEKETCQERIQHSIFLLGQERSALQGIVKINILCALIFYGWGDCKYCSILVLLHVSFVLVFIHEKVILFFLKTKKLIVISSSQECTHSFS